jgi:Secretion system C-terminal sorting domain
MNKYILKAVILATCLSCCQYLFGQKNDYIWLLGSGSNLRTNGDTIDGNVEMNFNYNPVQKSFDSISMNFAATDVSFSDSAGNLLFYTNGIYVANALDETMENGDSLNFGWYAYQFNTPLIGERLPGGILALPNPNPVNSEQFFLVHSYDDTLPGNGGNYYDNAITKLLCTLIDMQSNGRHGQVIYKNQSIMNGSFSIALTAAKNGNGRDWWLPVQKRASNCFYIVLFDTMGFHLIDSTCDGPSTVMQAHLDRSCFSPDGSKFIYLDVELGLYIYDFDRCSGTLNNLRYLPINPLQLDSNQTTDIGLAVSPNSRFLYVNTAYQLYQFDLSNDSIFASIDTVATYNGSYANLNLFSTTQLAPDGKIYMVSDNSISAYSVINNPDEPGAACNFTQRSVILPAAQYGIPNYPNYRLGSLPQSKCDTLSGLNDIQRAAKEQIIKVYPNPAADYAIIDYGFTDWSKAQPNLEICNTLGQTVYTQTLPMYSGLQKIDVSNWASGMYVVYVKRSGAVIASNKFVKQ